MDGLAGDFMKKRSFCTREIDSDDVMVMGIRSIEAGSDGAEPRVLSGRQNTVGERRWVNRGPIARGHAAKAMCMDLRI